jgi:hypothetical protein
VFFLFLCQKIKREKKKETWQFTWTFQYELLIKKNKKREKKKETWQFTWTFQYDLLLKKAWRVCWFGKNRDLLVSR